MIERVTSGISRTVFLVGRYAIKVPCCRYGWPYFLRGLLANLQERTWGRGGSPKLCPVLWADRFGLFVVMRRAEILAEPPTPMRFHQFTFGESIPPIECKADSFGVLDGRLVAVDYGN